MKALVYTGIKSFEFRDVPDPQLKEVKTLSPYDQ